jgi:hypothetical protein
MKYTAEKVMVIINNLKQRYDEAWGVTVDGRVLKGVVLVLVPPVEFEGRMSVDVRLLGMIGGQDTNVNGLAQQLAKQMNADWELIGMVRWVTTSRPGGGEGGEVQFASLPLYDEDEQWAQSILDSVVARLRASWVGEDTHEVTINTGSGKSMRFDLRKWKSDKEPN